MSTAQRNRKKQLSRLTKLLCITEKCWREATKDSDVDIENRYLFADAFFEEIRKLSTVHLKMLLKGHDDQIFFQRKGTLTVIKDEIFDRTVLKKK